MRVIGTAGHVDHGKSTLIAALTGIHPDRLKEEQVREMTIELGFGWMTLPNGEEVGIVDVPGHRDFIENMLSGIGGIDAVLLIVAADEGVMPQTREHLAILDLLRISSGIVVLTKTDLASDSAWLDLIEADIRNTLASTLLKDIPIVRVSAKNKVGLDKLVDRLEILLENTPSRLDLDRPRLPVDRVFTMSGFGTVVTGTLNDGHLSIGAEVQVLPSGLTGRIRGLQTHKKKEDIASPGSRTAVNITGISTEQIKRGDVITLPGHYQAVRRLDAEFQLLMDASASITHGQEIKFFTGASETMGTLRLLGTEELKPGQKAWIQLELENPIVAVRGDRYILRRPSPGETLGGGVIMDHEPKGRHKRFDENMLRSLESLAKGTPSDILLDALHSLSGISSIKDTVQRSRLESNLAEQTLREMMDRGILKLLEPGHGDASSKLLVSATSTWNSLTNDTTLIIQNYHKEHPLRRGMPREELKSKLQFNTRIFNIIIQQMESEGFLKDNAGMIKMPGHEVRFSKQEESKVQDLMRLFEENPFSPPSFKECVSGAGEEVVNALIEKEEFVLVSEDVLFRKQDYEFMLKNITNVLTTDRRITLAEVRDMFKTSRKYAQALLEHLDAIGLTVRDGDFRKLKK